MLLARGKKHAVARPGEWDIPALHPSQLFKVIFTDSYLPLFVLQPCVLKMGLRPTSLKVAFNIGCVDSKKQSQFCSQQVPKSLLRNCAQYESNAIKSKGSLNI